jgi:L-rhamnonate dehydratase
MNAISGFDNACWDIIGKALGEPVWRLLGGDAKPRIPAYCTGNDIEQHVEFGYKRLKVAMPAGPIRGEEGKRENVELVARARKAVGPDGDVMCDCWMSWDGAHHRDVQADGALPGKMGGGGPAALRL